jgi:hypothetical protein
MTYMEPPYVHAPVRHCLGKVLLDAGGFLRFLGANSKGRVKESRLCAVFSLGW